MMITAYLLMKLKNNGPFTIPTVEDVRIFSEPHPSMLGFGLWYAELHCMSGPDFVTARESLLKDVRLWPQLAWVFTMPGMQPRTL